MPYRDSSGTTRFTDDADRENYVKERSKALAASLLRADRDKMYSRSAGGKEVNPLEYWLKGDFDTVGFDLNEADRENAKFHTTSPVKFQIYKASADLLRDALSDQNKFSKFASENNIQNYQGKAWSKLIGNVPSFQGYTTNLIDLNKDKYKPLTGGAPVIAPGADPGHEAAVAALAATKNPVTTGPTGVKNPPVNGIQGPKKDPPASLTPEKWNSMTADQRDLYLRDYNAPNFGQTNPVTNTGPKNIYQEMADQDNRPIRDPDTGTIYRPGGGGNVPGQPVNTPGFRQDLQDMSNQDNRPIRDPDTGTIYRPNGQSNTQPGLDGSMLMPNNGNLGTTDFMSLVNQALMSGNTTNLNSYDWWNAAPLNIRQQAYAKLQEITGSAEGLAQYAIQNGITGLQNYSWWSSSPYKDKAWEIITNSRNQPQGGGLSTMPAGSGPAQSGPPPVNISDLFPTTQDDTGNSVLDFDTFMKQIGYKDYSSQIDVYTKKIEDVTKRITAREVELNKELGEARDNIWLSASSLDRRVNSAKARAQGDIDILLKEQGIYTESVKAINESMKQAQDAYSTYVDQAIKIENSKRENARLQLDFYKSQSEEYYKKENLNIQRQNQAMLYQNNLQDNARQAIATLTQALGPEALVTVDPQTFANAGFGSLDMVALAQVLKNKSQQDMLKNSDTPFSAWIQAYNSGDIAKMQAIETYMQSQKASGTNLGSYLLGGADLSLPSAAEQNVKLKGVKAEGELLVANCVKYQRYLEPTLPYGLTTLADKKRVLLSGPNASKAPVPGAVGIFDVGTEWGHVAKVVEVQGDRMRLLESNYGGQYIRDDRWVPINSAVGFWIPSGLQNRNDGSFPNIDGKFNEYYAQYKAGTRTKESILNDLTYGVTDKGQVKIIRDYVNSKWGQQEQIFAGLDSTGINNFFKMFGLNLNIPSLPAQSQPKYPLNQKQPGETSRKLTTNQILQLKSAGVWKDEYANINVWDLPDEVTIELF